EVTSSSTSEPKPQPVPGALVEVFDWTDPASCAALNRPNDSEFDCDAASSCPTDFGGRCIIGLVCDRRYDVGTRTLQAHGARFPWRSLDNVSSEQNQPRSVKLSVREATTD